jgi:hypothetical protein
MTTETVHPMVMKAAKTQFACDSGQPVEENPELWARSQDAYVYDAQLVLTECGALDLLEKAAKLEEAARCVQAGELHKDSLQIERMEMQKAIAKARDLSSAGVVYGSAPE